MLPPPKFLRSAGLCVMLLSPGALSLHAETAILDATGDASTPGGAASAKATSLQGPGTMFFAFKTWNIFRWNVESAELFLHVSKGPAPTSVEIAVLAAPLVEGAPPDAASLKFVPHKSSSEPDSYLSIKVDPKLVEQITAGKGHGLAVRVRSATAINTRESVAFVPRLIVNGGRP